MSPPVIDSGMDASRLPSPDPPSLPPVDARLAEPETRFEVIDGEQVYVMPANEEHGTGHSGLDYLLRAHVAEGYLAATDMLTRIGPSKDMAPDASVFPAPRDADTGGRQLEELAFEVASTQSMGDVAKRARDFTDRGVRRVFCLNVKKRRVFEWDSTTDDWRLMSTTGSISDPCFVRPLAVRALIDAAAQDDEVARALLAKKNAVLATALQEHFDDGFDRGDKAGFERARLVLARSILQLLKTRGLEVSASTETEVLACEDMERLQSWLLMAATASSPSFVRD